MLLLASTLGPSTTIACSTDMVHHRQKCLRIVLSTPTSPFETPQDHAHKEYESTVKVLQSAKTKTYGVRDEYRVSGQAAQILLRNALNSSLENSLGWLTTLQETYFSQYIPIDLIKIDFSNLQYAS